MVAALATLAMVWFPACAAPSADSNAWEQVFFSNWEHLEQDPRESQLESASEGGVVELAEVRQLEDLVILGAGPAGLTAAIYAARANLHPLLISRDSGQLATTSAVENFPSCQASPDGADIIASFWSQAKRFGARSLIAEVEHLELLSEPGVAHLVGGGEVRFRALIVASGAQSRRLELVPGEEHYFGRGVAGCATCEGWFFQGRDVVVIGGGDTAMEEALFLSRICKSVTVVHWRDSFRASKVMADLVLAHPTISIKWNSTVVEFGGDGDKLTSVSITNSWIEQDEVLATDGAFVAIGQSPNTEPLRGGPLDMDEAGYVKTHGGTHTNLDFVFAAGDCADRVYRQAITSSGTGAMAAMDAERYLCHLGC